MLSQLAQKWRACGMKAGDCVLIHSSSRRTLKTHGITPREMLESFFEAVAPDGTLLFPLFNFDFADGGGFDIRSTPSRMGALTEEARLYSSAVRSGHPIYSFAALGKEAEQFDVDNFSGYGSGSPFAVLRELDGKIAALDLEDQHSMTFYHHIEEMHEVDYRYHKEFTGPYTDADGTTDDRTYSLFVRERERGIVTDVNPMGEKLWEEGLYRGSRPKEGAGLRTIEANEMFEAVSEAIQKGEAQELLYSIEKR